MKIIELVNKFNNSPKGKIIKSFVMLFLSIALVVTVTIAWFFSNYSTTSAGMALAAKDEDSYAKYSAYYVDDIDTHTIAKINQTTANNNNLLDITLRPYDITFKSVNVYAPVVVKMEFYKIDSRFIPEQNQTRHLNLVLSRNVAQDNGTAQSLDGIFSSIGQIGCYSSSSLAYNASNVSIYDTVLAQYRLDNNLHKFTTVTNNTYSKINTLQIDIAYTLNDFKTGENNLSCLVLYMVIDYNITLTERFAEEQSGGVGLNNIDQRFDVDNDLQQIVIEFVENNN